MAADGVVDQEALDISETVSTATPWARYWSKNLDLVLWTSSFAYVAGGIFPDIFISTYTAVGSNDAILGIIIIPFAIILDTICVAAFGQTPGRALVGIKVVSKNGHRLNFTEALSRNFQLYVKGLGLGIPIVALFTFVFVFRRLKAGKETSWDHESGTVVESYSNNIVRTTIVAVIYVLILVSIRVWSEQSDLKIDREMQRTDVGAPRDPIEDQLRSAAVQMRGDLPKKLDDVTTLTDVRVSGRTLTYVHRISRRDASNDEILDFLRTTVTANACKDKQMNMAMHDYDVTYVYSYNLPNSTDTIDVEIEKASCSRRKVT